MDLKFKPEKHLNIQFLHLKYIGNFKRISITRSTYDQTTH